MKRNTIKRMMKKLVALSAMMALMLSLGSVGLAETAATDEVPEAIVTEVAAEDSTAETTTAALTDEEKAAAQAAARVTYDAAVDAALTDIVAAGALTQESVDGYHALRSAERQVEKIVTSNWTLDQVSAFKQAIQGKTVNETALAGLVSQGALTEADVAAIKLAYGDHVTISDLINQVDTSKATEAMVTALQDARTAYTQALSDAGIIGRGHDKGTGAKGSSSKSTKDSSNSTTGRSEKNAKNNH